MSHALYFAAGPGPPMGLKLTIFGLTLSSSWGNGHATPYRALLRALHRRGHRVVFYEKDVEYYFWRRDFRAWDYCELVLYQDWEQVRARALRDAAESDAVLCASFCPGGARIADQVLALARPRRVFYDLDTPVTLTRLERGDLDYLRRDQVPEFDLYLSWTGGRTLEELEQRWGARRARPLYGCVDPEAYPRVPPRPEFRCDLGYMGTYSPDRQHKLDALFLEPSRRMSEAEFVLAGTMYPADWQWGANVRRFDHIAPADHPAFYSSCRATLNITREEMARFGFCPSGRLFEAAACSTATLTDWWEGLETFFTPGEEVVVVGSAEDVLEALRRPEEDLARLAARARQRTLAEHTGDVRAGQLLAYLEETATRATQRPVSATSAQPLRPLR